MRHLMPIVTPRLILRPPTLDDLDSIQTAKEEAWSDLQLWMASAFDNQRSREAMENSIRRVMDYQESGGNRFGRDSIGSTGILLFEPHWTPPTSKMSMRQDTGQRRSTPDGAWRQRPQTQLSGTRSGTLVRGQSVSDSSTATSLAAASWRNWDSRNYALPIMQRYVVSTARSSIVMNIYSPAPIHYPLLTSHGDEAIRHVVHLIS